MIYWLDMERKLFKEGHESSKQQLTIKGRYQIGFLVVLQGWARKISLEEENEVLV